MSLYLTAIILAGFGVAYIAAKVANRPQLARVFIIGLGASAFVCFAFLTLDKMVGVGYTIGLYSGAAVAVAAGICAGLALRNGR